MKIVLTLVLVFVCQGTEAIESIFLDMAQATDLHISSHAFRKMPNLRLLAFASGIGFEGKRINNTLCLPTNLELPNNLRYIQWDGCPLELLPSICWPNKLVELSMPYSNAKKLWDGVQVCMIYQSMYVCLFISIRI